MKYVFLLSPTICEVACRQVEPPTARQGHRAVLQGSGAVRARQLEKQRRLEKEEAESDRLHVATLCKSQTRAG